MTRINCGIPPAELTDKHLLAEHREIKRIPNTIKSGKAKVENIPRVFTLGKGHVKFFYDKLYYLHIRYVLLYTECIKRGFKVTFYGGAFEGLPDHLYRDYCPTTEDERIIRERIKLRLSGVK
ncbi:MAG: deoxyribonuclease [Alteromonas sp.]|nr:deoxyribonuclease [Alteromonas sp.]|tara:strand:- start:21697 stop:22062 length:366 start_codon:yes stop_codon:yes gene_type:complete